MAILVECSLMNTKHMFIGLVNGLIQFMERVVCYFPSYWVWPLVHPAQDCSFWWELPPQNLRESSFLPLISEYIDFMGILELNWNLSAAWTQAMCSRTELWCFYRAAIFLGGGSDVAYGLRRSHRQCHRVCRMLLLCHAVVHKQSKLCAPGVTRRF